MQMTNRTRFGPFLFLWVVWNGRARAGVVGALAGEGERCQEEGGYRAQKRDCGLRINEINLIFSIRQPRRGPGLAGRAA